MTSRNLHVFLIRHRGWQEQHKSIKQLFKDYDQRHGWSVGRAYGHKLADIYGEHSKNDNIVFNVNDETMAALFRLTFNDIITHATVQPDFKS